jgi:hypothetical protein
MLLLLLNCCDQKPKAKITPPCCLCSVWHVAGVTEAFTHAVLDHAALAASNLMMVVFTAVHIAACFAFISTLGSKGLILADALTMALRICLSLL